MRLASPRIEKAAARRRTTLELSQDDVQTARAAFHSGLRSCGLSDPLTRTEAYEVFAGRGINPTEQRGPHLPRTFGGKDAVAQGPRKGAEDTFVLFADVASKDGLSRNTTDDSSTEHLAEPTLADITRRYVNSHGPVCIVDFVWWLGPTKTQARKALKLIDHLIVPFSPNSSASPDAPTDPEFIGEKLVQNEYFMPAWQQNVTESELEAVLPLTLQLSVFDEYLVDYGSRIEIPPESLCNQVSTRNGISWPFVVLPFLGRVDFPLQLSGMDQAPQDVVVKIPEAQGDPAQVFEPVVDGLDRPVGRADIGVNQHVLTSAPQSMSQLGKLLQTCEQSLTQAVDHPARKLLAL